MLTGKNNSDYNGTIIIRARNTETYCDLWLSPINGLSFYGDVYIYNTADSFMQIYKDYYSFKNATRVNIQASLNTNNQYSQITLGGGEITLVTSNLAAQKRYKLLLNGNQLLWNSLDNSPNFSYDVLSGVITAGSFSTWANYIVFKYGLILQWNKIGSNENNPVLITYPISFTASEPFVQVTGDAINDTPYPYGSTYATSAVNNFYLFRNRLNSQYKWFAIGH